MKTEQLEFKSACEMTNFGYALKAYDIHNGHYVFRIEHENEAIEYRVEEYECPAMQSMKIIINGKNMEEDGASAVKIEDILNIKNYSKRTYQQ